jgi:hypothetical protein
MTLNMEQQIESPSGCLDFCIKQSKVNRQRSTVKSQRSTVKSQQSKVNRQKSKVNRQKSTAINRQKSTVNRQRSTAKSQPSTVKGQPSTRILKKSLHTFGFLCYIYKLNLKGNTLKNRMQLPFLS